jgi:glycosyltransferase involved in cell wall biosynthesis
MNILITCDRLDTLGGLEEHVINKVQYLLNNGHRVHLDCNAISEYYKNKISHKNLLISSPWSNNWGDVIKDINGFMPDIIHAHPFSAIDRGNIVRSYYSKAKFFITIHGEYCYTVPHYICDRTDKIILVNDKIKNYNDYKTVVIPNGIDTKRFSKSKTKKEYDGLKTRIAVISRLQDNKEIPVFEFLNVSNRIKSYMHIDIVGDGKYLDEVKEKVKEKDEKYVQYNITGAVSNVEIYMQEADLVLGCDRVALEALCCGTDVFYMGQGHWKNIVTISNYKDYIFSNKGIQKYTENELVDNLSSLVWSKNLGKQLGLYDEIRKKYSLDAQMKQILDLYKG